LLSSDRGIYEYIEHRLLWEGFMKYALEIGSGAMLYIPSFIKIGSSIQKLVGRIDRYTDGMVIS
jgi:hypothetical protein